MNKTQKFTRLALIMALLVILGFTPLGFIAVPPVSITLMHIPVIIGSIILGYSYGGFLGLAFGVISMIKATTTPLASDILFSPVLSGAPVYSVIMCVVPRILLGIIPGLLCNVFKKIKMPEILSIGVSAAVSTIIHTFSVLFFMSIFFGGMTIVDIFKFIVAINGSLEILAAIVVSIAICKPLLVLYKRKSN